MIATNEELVGNLEIERNRLIKYESDLEVRKVQVQGLSEELTRIDSELEHDNSLLEQLTGEYEVSQEKMISTGVTRASYLAQKMRPKK